MFGLLDHYLVLSGNKQILCCRGPLRSRSSRLLHKSRIRLFLLLLAAAKSRSSLRHITTEGEIMNYKRTLALFLFITTACASRLAVSAEAALAPAVPGVMLTAKSVSSSVAAAGTTDSATSKIGDDMSFRIGDVTPESIRKAVDMAKKLFAKNPRQIIVIDIPRGTYDLSGAPGSAINVSDVKPGDGGWLIFRGVGPQNTTLKLSKTGVWVYGKSAHRVAFQGLRMVCAQQTVSQGHVVSVGKGKVVLDIQDGFATPGEIFCAGVDRNWMRQYTNSRTNPLMIQDAVIPVNKQVRWASATPLSERRWQLNLSNPRELPPYLRGALIGIKAKQTGNVCSFTGSSDIIFENIEWSGKSRGVFCKGTSRVTILNCKIKRGEPINGQTPCLSTPDGGPQIGQPNDEPTTGNRVENCDFEASGDDSIAFFNSSGTIRNNRVRDSFGRGILLFQSPGANLENNTVIRCPIMNML